MGSRVDEITRCLVETLHVEPNDDPIVGRFERGLMEWDDASCLLEAGLEEGFDVPGARRDRQRVLVKVSGSKSTGRSNETSSTSTPRTRSSRNRRRSARMAIPRCVPATHHVDQTVGVDQPLGGFALADS